ncbi:src like adaptor 1a [Synchiropus picturatus]
MSSRRQCTFQVLQAAVLSIRRMGNLVRGACPKARNKNLQGSSNDLEEDVMVVLEDHPSPDVSTPIHRMGEKLTLISQESYWCRVVSHRTGKENYIPKSLVAKVYHGWLFEGVERKKAEELLMLPGNRVGSFLVREGLRERGVYVLSVKHRTVKHYRILRLDNNWYYISPRLTFQCLEDLISHYSDCADGLCCVLTSPCLSTSPELTAGTSPVVMRRSFDWQRIDSGQLLSNTSSNDMVSYGVRNSIAAYLSLSGAQDHTRAESRRKKSKSVYAIPEKDPSNLDFEDF